MRLLKIILAAVLLVALPAVLVRAATGEVAKVGNELKAAAGDVEHDPLVGVLPARRMRRHQLLRGDAQPVDQMRLRSRNGRSRHRPPFGRAHDTLPAPRSGTDTALDTPHTE